MFDMFFDDSYKKYVTQSECYDQKLSNKKPRTTILPFFGFALRGISQSSISTYGGNVYVTQETADTYKVTKSATGIYNRTKHYLEFYRETPVFTDYELESKVQKWLKDNKFNDIWQTPYICPTLADYHEVYGEHPKKKLLNRLALLSIILGAVLTGLLFINSDMVASLLPEFLSFLVREIAITPLSGGVLLAILLLIYKSMKNKEYRAVPLHMTDIKYQENLRSRYYSGMVNLFGKEIGTQMQKLSSEREKHLAEK